MPGRRKRPPDRRPTPLPSPRVDPDLADERDPQVVDHDAPRIPRRRGRLRRGAQRRIPKARDGRVASRARRRRLDGGEALAQTERQRGRAHGLGAEATRGQAPERDVHGHVLEPGLPLDVPVAAPERERREPDSPGHERRPRPGERHEERVRIRVDLPEKPVRPEDEARRSGESEDARRRAGPENQPATATPARA